MLNVSRVYSQDLRFYYIYVSTDMFKRYISVRRPIYQSPLSQMHRKLSFKTFVFTEIDHHTVRTCSIHGTKHSKDNQLKSPNTRISFAAIPSCQMTLTPRSKRIPAPQLVSLSPASICMALRARPVSQGFNSSPAPPAVQVITCNPACISN